MNVFSARYTEKIQKEAKASIIGKAPPPPFKIQYANTELENASATYDEYQDRKLYARRNLYHHD